jgi:secreted Zn-dependent insulinase-like peptidase
MQGEDVENIIRKSYEIDHFDKERTQEMLNLVSDPTQCNIYIRSKKFEGKTDKEAPWYSTKYSSEKFSEDLLNKMNNPSCDQSEKKLEIPPPNTLLPKKFDILPEDKAVSQKPILVKTWDNAHLWYSKDDKFKMPKAVVSMKVYTNDCDFGKTLQGRLQALIWQKVVNEYMREFLYNAECASLNFSVNLMHDNI